MSKKIKKKLPKLSEVKKSEVKVNIQILGLEDLRIKVGDEIIPLDSKRINEVKNAIEVTAKKADNLQFMMDCQRVFQSRFGEDFNKMDDKERTAFIKNHGYFIIEELVEMFREMRYHKSWKDYSDWTDEKRVEQLQKAKEEYIDILHFVINVGLALGLDSDEIVEMYKEKNKLNIERQENPELGYVK